MSVTVVGAGPTGLTLAAELASSGVRTRLLERRPEPAPWSRAFGLMPHTMELLDLRGELEPFLDAGTACPDPPLGDPRGRRLDYSLLDTPFPFILILPQNRTEQLLERWARRAGVEIVRGTRVTGLWPDRDGVTIAAEGPDGAWRDRSDVVVGCDGVRSAVRQAQGIPFPGRGYDESLVIADVVLAEPPDPPVYARITARGMVAAYPFGGGTYRLIVLDRDRMSVPVEQPVTMDEIAESCRRVLGGDELRFGEPRWLSRFRSAQRHAATYRRGRVLLAGDAAHTHIPSGGQGLQVGIQDAMNLGWKLAADLAGWAPPRVLDSYESERLPIAAATLRKTDLAFRFETSALPGTGLLRRGIAASMRVRRVQARVLAEFAGLTVDYGGADRAHPLVGRRLPDAVVRTAHGPRRLFPQFRARRFVLLDQRTAGTDPAAGWADRVTYVRGRVPDRPDWPALVLARPDGYVAWAGTDPGGPAAVLSEWCGPPAPVPAPREGALR